MERDSLGEKAVPAEAYYGVQTQRAVENFPISGMIMHPGLIEATIMIKLAAAEINTALGGLEPEIGGAIVRAAKEALNGEMQGQFPVDVYQAGAGTSHNMNVNEVLANRAIEILGGKRGNYKTVHPNDHVNMGQSTNDVFPTAMRLATLRSLNQLYSVGRRSCEIFREKGDEFYPFLKSGRTHLQDALPIRLGQEFRAYAAALEGDFERLCSASQELKHIGIGGTAVGSGANSLPGYREMMIKRLSELMGSDLKPKKDLFEAMQNMNVFASIASHLKLIALSLVRIANDLRLLGSGPHTGLAEIALPPVQPGSSIMAGKINPAIPEMVNMVCFQIIGNETTVAWAVQAGQLELNVMMPVIAHNLLASIDILTNSLSIFSDRCVKGITVNAERCRNYMESSTALSTLLNPLIGYQEASDLAKEASKRNVKIKDLVRDRGILSEEEFQKLIVNSIKSD